MDNLRIFTRLSRENIIHDRRIMDLSQKIAKRESYLNYLKKLMKLTVKIHLKILK